jgi:hypothetical protein
MVAATGDGAAVVKGRDFAAWLGLVPKQISTSDRTILGGISWGAASAGVAIDISVPCSFRAHVPFFSGLAAGRNTASLAGLQMRHSHSTRMCWLSPLPTSSPELPGRYSFTVANANRNLMQRLRDRRHPSITQIESFPPRFARWNDGNGTRSPGATEAW